MMATSKKLLWIRRRAMVRGASPWIGVVTLRARTAYSGLKRHQPGTSGSNRTEEVEMQQVVSAKLQEPVTALAVKSP